MNTTTGTLGDSLFELMKRRVIDVQDGARHSFKEADYHRACGLMIRAVQWQRDMAMAHEQARIKLEKLLYLQGTDIVDIDELDD